MPQTFRRRVARLGRNGWVAVAVRAHPGAKGDKGLRNREPRVETPALLAKILPKRSGQVVNRPLEKDQRALNFDFRPDGALADFVGEPEGFDPRVHGALGASNEMPFNQMLVAASVLGIADGPTEVHKVTVARQVLRGYSASDDLWPSQHIPRRLAAAREKYAEYLEHEIGNQ